MKLFLIAFLVLFAGCNKEKKRMALWNKITQNAPDGHITPCLISGPDSHIECYDYSLKRVEWTDESEDALPDITHESMYDLPMPGFYLTPEDMASIKRQLIYFVPEAYIKLKKYNLSKKEMRKLTRWYLDELMPNERLKDVL